MAVDAVNVTKPASGGVRFLEIITESAIFKNFILLCIIANAITLGIEAQLGERFVYRDYIMQLDVVFLTIFTVELALEFLAQGPRRYLRNGWNWFDVAVVGVSYISAVPAFAALRTLRVFRVLRLVSNIESVRRVAEALVQALPGIAAATMVLAIVFYIGAVMSTLLFGQQLPDLFGTLGQSAFTLFQLSLFDSWGETVSAVNAVAPLGGFFLLAFTILTAFAVMNLFIGVIVDAVQTARDDQIGKPQKPDELGAVTAELRALREEVRALRAERT